MPTHTQKQTFYSISINGVFHDVTGRKRTKSGYVTLCVKSHPFAGKDGYVFEHRIIMEQILDRYLDKDEIVHHKNGKKHDNRFGNLEVMKHSDHTILHNTGATRSIETRRLISLKMKERLADKFKHHSYKNIDKQHLMRLLEEYGPTKTSSILNVTRKTIYNKIKEFKLEEWYEGVKQNNLNRKTYCRS
ncbi:HNH endonuclease [Paenibacillus gorillae]|uniref:HNH endonuclease n=1 Tax=Paenibacillus gorillae TaxID=1243662 RepID=UPI0006941226